MIYLQIIGKRCARSPNYQLTFIKYGVKVSKITIHRHLIDINHAITTTYVFLLQSIWTLLEYYCTIAINIDPNITFVTRWHCMVDVKHLSNVWHHADNELTTIIHEDDKLLSIIVQDASNILPTYRRKWRTFLNTFVKNVIT